MAYVHTLSFYQKMNGLSVSFDLEYLRVGDCGLN
jgi:hypothetical protein